MDNSSSYTYIKASTMRTIQILEDIFEDSFNIVITKHTPISFLKNLKTIQFIHLHIEIAKVINVYVKTKDFQKCETIEDLATLINNKVENKMKIAIELDAKCQHCRHWCFLDEDQESLPSTGTYCKLDKTLKDKNNECNLLELDIFYLEDTLRNVGYKTFKIIK